MVLHVFAQIQSASRALVINRFVHSYGETLQP